ncbi:unnamed protein product [Heligmosomoides polygyrus]|uniref:Cytochrome P450 n=1 Tax=Heligmosomoides polygyrus TaxID=6339 RepID=A0A3P8AKH8_HELPZ|nr:unnamed protein product [Heligmosomoides polygyrus]
MLTLYFYEPGYDAFGMWKRKYDRPAIVLADYELMKETLVKNGAAYTGRQEVPLSRMLRGGEYGIVDTSGALWQQHRRFAIQVFRDFGMGKDMMQNRILEEVSDFLKKCKQSADDPLDLRNHIDMAVGNNQLRKVCFDLWLAGMETTSNTLYWGILYILLDSGVQKAIHDELDIKIGSDRLITMADRSKLHYMNAAITEIQRLANLLPMNVLHETTCDVEIEGYSIPKGTLVLPQISTVMYDEEVR